MCTLSVCRRIKKFSDWMRMFISGKSSSKRRHSISAINALWRTMSSCHIIRASYFAKITRKSVTHSKGGERIGCYFKLVLLDIHEESQEQRRFSNHSIIHHITLSHSCHSEDLARFSCRIQSRKMPPQISPRCGSPGVRYRSINERMMF